MPISTCRDLINICWREGVKSLSLGGNALFFCVLICLVQISGHLLLSSFLEVPHCSLWHLLQSDFLKVTQLVQKHQTEYTALLFATVASQLREKQSWLTRDNHPYDVWPSRNTPTKSLGRGVELFQDKGNLPPHPTEGAPSSLDNSNGYWKSDNSKNNPA